MKRKYKRLLFADRQMIEKFSKEGKKIPEIAKEIGVHRDTIYKELKRCDLALDKYDADLAQKSL